MRMCAVLRELIFVVEWNLFPSLEKRDLPSRESLSLLNKAVTLVISTILDENIVLDSFGFLIKSSVDEPAAELVNLLHKAWPAQSWQRFWTGTHMTPSCDGRGHMSRNRCQPLLQLQTSRYFMMRVL